MNMKHILLCFFTFPFVSTGLFAQSPIRIEPAEYRGAFAVDLEQTPLLQDPTVTITNTTDSTLALRWELFNLDKPSAWESQVCDPNECYLPIVRSNIDDDLGIDAPVMLAPDSSVNISIYIMPDETIGTGKFALDFSLASDPATVVDMATFEVEITSAVVSTFETIRKQDIRVFPNPATDYFELMNSEAIDRVVLFNLVGRQVGTFLAYPGKQYDISDLPSGTYMVALVNERFGTIRTMRLVKRSFRP